MRVEHRADCNRFIGLKRLRVPVRFIRFPEESHGLSRGGKPRRRAERLGYITEWFGRWL
jgi:dipeptidyl aminopeptidase/acylaminoacyl peptidase